MAANLRRLSGVAANPRRFSGVAANPLIHKLTAQRWREAHQVNIQESMSISWRRDSLLRTIMFTFMTATTDNLTEE